MLAGWEGRPVFLKDAMEGGVGSQNYRYFNKEWSKFSAQSHLLSSARSRFGNNFRSAISKAWQFPSLFCLAKRFWECTDFVNGATALTCKHHQKLDGLLFTVALKPLPAGAGEAAEYFL